MIDTKYRHCSEGFQSPAMLSRITHLTSALPLEVGVFNSQAVQGIGADQHGSLSFRQSMFGDTEVISLLKQTRGWQNRELGQGERCSDLKNIILCSMV